MVSLTFPRLDYDPEPNLTRPMLNAAVECEQRGDLVAAGVRLREAIRRYLFSACEWHNCLPAKTRRRSPRELAKALLKAGFFNDDGYEWVTEMIDCGNAAAHCGRVDRGVLRSSMALLYSMLDFDPCGDRPERFAAPKIALFGSCDDSDDDGESWKAGVA
jgi:hypothetical protein